MNLTREAVLTHLDSMSGSTDFATAEELLRSPHTVPFDPVIAGKNSRDRIVRPKDIISTWSVRCDNASRTGYSLYGCADFVKRLRALPDSTEIVNIAFTNRRATGLFWFDSTCEDLIGFVIAPKGLLPNLP